MKVRTIGRSKVSSIYFYFFLLISFVGFLLLVSCSFKNGIIEPRGENYFDSLLLNSKNYFYSGIPVFGVDENPILSQQKRALINWYCDKESRVSVFEILGDNVKVNLDKASIKVLDIVFDPSKNGIYNVGEISNDYKNNWGGINCRMPDSIANLFNGNNLVINIWIKIVNSSPGAVLNIDIGKISEDIIPNGKLDAEDKNNNGILDSDEDTGIDGIKNIYEPNYQSQNDPNNDDYSNNSETGNEKINGLERNNVSFKGNSPDSEDLNKNSILDVDNDYFNYQIPLNKDMIEKNKIVQSGRNGWINLKIPVDLPDYKIGKPSLTIIQTLRFWISNALTRVNLKIAQVEFNKI